MFTNKQNVALFGKGKAWVGKENVGINLLERENMLKICFEKNQSK